MFFASALAACSSKSPPAPVTPAPAPAPIAAAPAPAPTPAPTPPAPPAPPPTPTGTDFAAQAIALYDVGACGADPKAEIDPRFDKQIVTEHCEELRAYMRVVQEGVGR